jgi:hypothetical protein
MALREQAGRFPYILAIILILLGAGAAASFAEENEPINPEWVQNDMKGVEMLLRVMPVENHSTVETITQVLEGDWTVRDDALGFGARRIKHSKGFGYTVVYVDVLAFNGQPAFCEIGLYKPADRDWALIRKHLVDTWKANGGPAFEEDKNRLFFQRRNDSLFDAYYKAVAEGLGPMRTVNVPPKLQEAYLYLTSSLNNSRVGDSSCGLHGGILEGKKSIQLLIDAKRVDLIENVLRGYNPSGRIYAAIALLRMERKGLSLKPETVATIHKVEELDVPVDACSGCIVKSGLRGKDVIRAYAKGAGFAELGHSSKREGGR